MSCLLTTGITLNCSSSFVGGVDPTIYVCQRQDFTTELDVTTGGYISNFSFLPYRGFKKFETRKKQISAGYSLSKSPDGTVNYDHTVNLKLFAASPTDLATLESLADVTDLVMVVVNRNRTISIYGAQQGLELTEGSQNTGVDSSADTSHNYTFVAEGENYLPKMFLFQNYNASIARLEQLLD